MLLPLFLDLSRFLEAPAGWQGFLRTSGEHIVYPNGRRFRFWGVNVCASDCFPPKDKAPEIAQDLARFGFNIVRFHHMDATWGRNIFPEQTPHTSALDSEMLDRLDFFIAELKKRGIYANLNLNVSRHFRDEDGVRDHDLLGYGKSATYYNPRIIELQREFARQLLTHRNSYTGNEYRHEPAVAVVELVNENSILEGWVGWRLEGKDDPKASTWSPLPVSYAEELTSLYNEWLRTNTPPDLLEAIRREVGVERVPRLRPDQFASASAQRFRTEARFYCETERNFFIGMQKLLRNELKVKSMLIGTADHNDGYAAYAHILANLELDFVDGHGYWEHPRLDGKTWIKNTPMVNDPLDSTVTQFARSPVAGRAFTISEVNHPFPHEYSGEGFPILTAYAMFHDWDGIYWFTWGRGGMQNVAQGIQPNGWFDFSNDPIKLASLYACGLAWHRRDVESARRTVVRSYNADEMFEALRMDRKQRPFFAPGFLRATALVHRTRSILKPGQVSFASATTRTEATAVETVPAEIRSDTGQLAWLSAHEKKGRVLLKTPKSEMLAGFVRGVRSKHITLEVTNEFATVWLTSLDDRPIETSKQLLLVAVADGIRNTDQTWEEDRQTLKNWGTGRCSSIRSLERLCSEV